MLFLDVNPLLYALRADVFEHAAWLEELIHAGESYAVCGASLTAVIRIATSKKVFKTPIIEK